MPQDSTPISLLPAGINIENLPCEEENQVEVMAHEPLFGEEVDHNMNSPHKFGVRYMELSHREHSEDEDDHSPASLLPHESIKPRCVTPSSSDIKTELPNSVPDLNEKLNPVTPTKPMECDDTDPWTPTANLKMLMSAASPEIRSRERRQEMNKHFKEINDSVHSQPIAEPVISKPSTKSKAKKKCKLVVENPDRLVRDEGVDMELEIDSLSSHPSRKEKSLGLLCHRFLSKFPKYPGPLANIQICLDAVAKDLYVERRRIYDIVNVLESVEIVSRLAKNKYAWHGQSNLVHTLAKLSALAEQEGFIEQVDKIKGLELNREMEGVFTEQESNDTSSSFSSVLSDTGHEKSPSLKPTCINYLRDNLKKDKSLGIMSQRFIMLFLVSKPKIVNLDLAAKILIGDPNIDKTENAKFKTKIRRLYDIANILTSLDLITKVHVTEVRGRKPAFEYIGPDINLIDNLSTCSHDGAHRPSSRHSLLDCIQNPQVGSILSTHKSFKPSTSKKPLLNPESSHLKSSVPPPLAKKSAFTRHSSFEQICEVAELERNRLYFESSRSEPSSPSKGCSKVSTPEARTQSKVAVSKQVVTCKSEEERSPGVSSPGNKPVIGMSQDSSKKTVILKSAGSGSQVLTLSEKQLREILKNLGSKVTKTSTGVSIQTDSKYVDASTQSSPELVSGLLSLFQQKNGPTTTESPAARSNIKIMNPGQTPARVKIIKVSCSEGERSAKEQNISQGHQLHAQGHQLHAKRPLEGNEVNNEPEGKKPKMAEFTGNNNPAARSLMPLPVKVEKCVKVQGRLGAIQLAQLRQDAEVPISITHMPQVVKTELQVPSTSSPVLMHVTHSDRLFSAQHLATRNVPFQYVTTQGISLQNLPTEEKVPLQNIPVQNVSLQTIPQGVPTRGVPTPKTPTQNVSSPTPHSRSVIVPDTARLVEPRSRLVEPRSVSQPTTGRMMQSLSQPNTPTFHLSDSSSPVLLLPARPASLEAPPQFSDTPPSSIKEPSLVVPVSQYVVPATVRHNLPGFGTFVSPITAGTPTYHPAPALMLNPADLSPLSADGHAQIRNASQGHVFMPNTIVSPITGLQVTPTQNHLFKAKSGIQPSSNNIINLMPLFGSPSGQPPGATRSLISACPQKVTPVSIATAATVNINSPAMNPSPSQIIRLPLCSPAIHATDASPDSAFITPKNMTSSITVNGRPVTTPGCFFRSTPGGLQQLPTSGIIRAENSAFQVVSRYTINSGEGPVSTARRLQLHQDDTVV